MIILNFSRIARKGKGYIFSSLCLDFVLPSGLCGYDFHAALLLLTALMRSSPRRRVIFMKKRFTFFFIRGILICNVGLILLLYPNHMLPAHCFKQKENYKTRLQREDVKSKQVYSLIFHNLKKKHEKDAKVLYKPVHRLRHTQNPHCTLRTVQV